MVSIDGRSVCRSRVIRGAFPTNLWRLISGVGGGPYFMQLLGPSPGGKKALRGMAQRGDGYRTPRILHVERLAPSASMAPNTKRRT